MAARIIDRAECAVLGVELVKIIAKLRDDFKGEFVMRMETFGFRRVKKIVDFGSALGE